MVKRPRSLAAAAVSLVLAGTGFRAPAQETNAQPPADVSRIRVTWSPQRAPAATSPDLAASLRIERAHSGTWFADRPLEAVFDPATGALLVDAPFEGIARIDSTLWGLRCVGRELRIHTAQPGAVEADGYQGARDAAWRARRSQPEAAVTWARAIDLERLFGIDVVFPRRTSRPWSAAATVTRVTTSPNGGVLVDLRGFSGRSLRVVLDENQIPRQTFVDGTPQFIVDRGVVRDKRDPGDAPRWDAPERFRLLTPAGERFAIARRGEFVRDPAAVDGAVPLWMALDPRSGSVVAHWAWREHLWWAPAAHLIGDTLVIAGCERSTRQVHLVESVARIEPGPGAPEALRDLEPEWIRRIRDHAPPAGRTVHLARIPGLESIVPLQISEVRPAGGGEATCIVDVEAPGRGAGSLELVFNRDSELSAARLNITRPEPGKRGGIEPLEIPGGIIEPIR